MTAKQKRNLARILVALAAFIASYIIGTFTQFGWICFIAVYLLIGWDTIWKAVINISSGQIFDENFLMVTASIGAIILGDYSEATAVMLFYKIGTFFESFAVSRSRQSIAQLMDIRPDYANIEKDGKIVAVDPEEIAVGDMIIVHPGEKIPLDGTVAEGYSSLDTAALTGESIPRDVFSGDQVVSGCINLNGVLKIRVDREFHNSTVSQILDLVENSELNKSQSESFISRFAKYYTPIVCAAALAVALIPSIITGDWSVWINRALVFLVVSCPCALVISVPLSFFSGIGGASKQGILIKGANYLEQMAKTSTVVLDKTGTLTKGDFTVTNIITDIDQDTLLYYAAHAEYFSQHPIAQSIKLKFSGNVNADAVSDYEEFAGKGVKATVSGKTIYAGNDKLMSEIGVKCPQIEDAGAVIYVSDSQTLLGTIVVADSIKPDSKQALQDIKSAGVKHLVMLTGDNDIIAKKVAGQLGIDKVHSQLLPQDKVSCMTGIMNKYKNVAYVGDGINDAPVLAQADIGISMGVLGSDAAIEAADIVLMDDKLTKIATTMRISRKTLAIVKQNIVFSLAVKIAVMLMSLFGIFDAFALYLAVFADVGVSVICIINAMRAMKTK